MWTFIISAWSDPYMTWVHRAEIKVPAGGCRVGARGGRQGSRAGAVRSAAEAGLHAGGHRGSAKRRTSRGGPVGGRHRPGEGDRRALPLRDLVYPLRPVAAVRRPSACPIRLLVRVLPRSIGATATSSGTFAEATKRLDAIAAMGFDVVYLPPIHPIGTINRKGANNTLEPGPGNPPRPGRSARRKGGTTRCTRSGNDRGLRCVRRSSRDWGMEVALDLALQVAPDHPWAPPAKLVLAACRWQHRVRREPPKKYQDIYPCGSTATRMGCMKKCCACCTTGWITTSGSSGSTTRTPAGAVLGSTAGRDPTHRPGRALPGQRFTRPAMMRALAEVGFPNRAIAISPGATRSGELESTLRFLSGRGCAYMRPNFFTNTPTSRTRTPVRRPRRLRHSGDPGVDAGPDLRRLLRLELFEQVAVRPGSEEYLDSRNTPTVPRDFAAAEAQERHGRSVYITVFNDDQTSSPCLQQMRDLTFHQIDSDQMIAFSKRTAMTS